MRLYNLTDHQAPGKPARESRVLRTPEIEIVPGGFVDVEDTFNLSTISGWLHSGLISIGNRPAWYVALRAEEAKEKSESRYRRRKKRDDD